ncbi:hypothetical protein CSW62_03155 [Caulobacter sp. FWC2]|nr:hypothetical protein CSW62_03155 [Caulobacter sp. FWC2]
MGGLRPGLREVAARGGWPCPRLARGHAAVSEAAKGPGGVDRSLSPAGVGAAVVGRALVVRDVAHNHPTGLGSLFGWLLTGEKDSKLVEQGLGLLASTGTFGATVALGLAGLRKVYSSIKLPLSLKLEKYIARPDYEGHVAFIETFHLDLNRLIEVYAGDRRVFIFIDDLDRCDVPRAADLMQAINLMIGDSKNLVFVIGMDREKVAAGIAQKYKDILPFLRDSAHWKPNDEKDTYTPLYFGYGYLEKFIQISFSLPIANENALDSFFAEEPATAARPVWSMRLREYWTAWFRTVWPGAAPPTAEVASDPVQQSQVEVEARRRKFQSKMERDSDRIREVVKLVSGVFEHNPRRIKQFISTFRLALYIANDQGLFDSPDDREPDITPEQIGKCVALLLRFPDLRFVLEQDRALLGKLQAAALGEVAARPAAYHWLEKPGAIELLTSRCRLEDASDAYSLANFDIRRLLSVLPRVPRPADPADRVIAAFAELGRRYEAIRADEPASAARTRKMTALVHEALALAGRLSASDLALALSTPDDSDGARLMRIMLASIAVNAANLTWLLGYNGTFRTPFEHYWCIRVLTDYVPAMDEAQRARVNADLGARWAEIATDRGRVAMARRLLDMTSPKSSPARPATSGGRRSRGQHETATLRWFEGGKGQLRDKGGRPAWSKGSCREEGGAGLEARRGGGREARALLQLR